MTALLAAVGCGPTTTTPPSVNADDEREDAESIRRAGDAERKAKPKSGGE